MDHYFPKVHYHPLALPDRRGPLQLDPATINLIQLTWNTLNQSSPEWAQDCWICLTVGTPRLLAMPANLSQPVNTSVDPAACKVTPSLRVQPIEASIGYCLRGQIADNETALDVGVGDFASCTTVQNITPQYALLIPWSLSVEETWPILSSLQTGLEPAYSQSCSQTLTWYQEKNQSPYPL